MNPFAKQDVAALDFAPAMLRMQAPAPLPVLYALFVLFAGLMVWAVLGRLDIVAVAQGKIVPQSFLKIVQPAEQGIVREILVKDGDTVREGQRRRASTRASRRRPTHHPLEVTAL